MIYNTQSVRLMQEFIEVRDRHGCQGGFKEVEFNGGSVEVKLQFAPCSGKCPLSFLFEEDIVAILPQSQSE